MQGKGRTLFDTPAAALPACLIAAVSHALPCMKTQGKARMDLGRADVKTLVEHQLEVCSDLKNTQGPLTSAGQTSTVQANVQIVGALPRACAAACAERCVEQCALLR